MPDTAVHDVAPLEVNCCVAPRFNVTEAGEICWALGLISVTVAEADPPGPVAVTFTLLEAGIAAGAV